MMPTSGPPLTYPALPSLLLSKPDTIAGRGPNATTFCASPLDSIARLRGLGGRLSSPSGSGWSPAAKRFLVIIRLKMVPPSAVFPLDSIARLRGLGERFSYPSGSGRSPAAKRFLVIVRLKIMPSSAHPLASSALPSPPLSRPDTIDGRGPSATTPCASPLDSIAWLRGLGERLSSPSGSGRSPAAKRLLVIF